MCYFPSSCVAPDWAILGTPSFPDQVRSMLATCSLLAGLADGQKKIDTPLGSTVASR